MSISDFITWSPLPWLVIAGLLAWALCRAAAVGDRQLEQARENLAKPPIAGVQSSNGFTYRVEPNGNVQIMSVDDADQLYRWAFDDGHRHPGIDETRARRDTRPYGGLCEIVPMDELRRRRDQRVGGAA